MPAGRVEITIERGVARRVAEDLVSLAREMTQLRRYRQASTLLFVAAKLSGSKVPLRPYSPRQKEDSP